MNIIKLFRRLRPEPKLKPEFSPDRLEIVLSGSGGQGMVLAGRILAEAAAIYDQKDAVMAQSYGPEARGGASRAEIIISQGPIDYPKVMNTDVLLVMTQEALTKYGKLLRPQGLLVVDETYIKEVPSSFKNVFKAPFSTWTVKVLDTSLVANIMALGAIAAITQAVSREALIRAVLNLVPEKALILDRIAVDAGFKAVADQSFKWTRNKP